MEDPKVLFADTTARRAQLMAATERFKASISDNVEAIKGDANEVGKTVAFVAGVSFAVYLVANAILPKSDEYRYAEKYGEPDDRPHRPEHTDAGETIGRKQKKEIRKSAASSGLIGGLITSVLTAVARQQLAGFLERIRQNNAINPAARPTSGDPYHQKPTTNPA